jgi:acyl-CoA thioester hydrolase
VSRRHSTSIELQVPFHHVDPLGVVWHGHYYKYMEQCRMSLLGGLGLDGDELVATGHLMYVIESHCRHSFPLQYRDLVRVTGWIDSFDHYLKLRFHVHNLSRDRRSAKGMCKLAVTDLDGTLIMEMPPALRRRIEGKLELA